MKKEIILNEDFVKEVDEMVYLFNKYPLNEDAMADDDEFSNYEEMIDFLIDDEETATDAYDKAIKFLNGFGELTDDQKKVIEDIKKDEQEHVKLLNALKDKKPEALQEAYNRFDKRKLRKISGKKHRSDKKKAKASVKLEKISGKIKKDLEELRKNKAASAIYGDIEKGKKIESKINELQNDLDISESHKKSLDEARVKKAAKKIEKKEM